MSFIKVILEAEATGEIKAVYEKTLAGCGRQCVREGTNFLPS